MNYKDILNLIFHFYKTKFYSFSIAAITNCHESGDIKQRKSMLLQLWRSDIQNYFHLAKSGHTFFRGSRRETVSFIFQLVLAAGIPWLAASSLQSSRLASSNRPLLCVDIAFPAVLIRCLSASPFEGYI